MADRTGPPMPATTPPNRANRHDRYDRYGRSTTRPRPLGRTVRLALAGALAVAAVGWAGWVAFAGRDAVRWQDGAFTRLDDGRAQLVVEVTARPGRRVVCTVRMFNQGLTEVGRADVTAGPSAQGSFRVTATVPTFEAATSGTVRACASLD